MKSLSFVSISLIFILNFASSVQEQKFTPEQMKVDLDFMLKTFEEVHPNLYLRFNKTDVEYARHTLENQLSSELTVQNFYELVSPFVKKFEDGHTRLGSPDYHQENQVAEASGSAESYRFFVLKEGVGLIDFRAFENLERFQGFLRNTFLQVKTQGIRTLIIDLRDNGGGNSALGDALLEYITDQPYRQFSRFERKVSSQARTWFLSQNGSMPWADGQEIGSIYKAEGNWHKPATNALRFFGKVFVLIAEPTFSSAVSFAATIKDLKLGTLVGQETGGKPTDFGDYYPFKLPNTQLEAVVSTTFWVRPGGFDNRHGVFPDVNVDADEALDWVLKQP
jgi:hypothetical protein